MAPKPGRSPFRRLLPHRRDFRALSTRTTLWGLYSDLQSADRHNQGFSRTTLKCRRTYKDTSASPIPSTGNKGCWWTCGERATMRWSTCTDLMRKLRNSGYFPNTWHTGHFWWTLAGVGGHCGRRAVAARKNLVLQ